MGYRHISGFRILAEALGLKVLWSRPMIGMVAIAIIGCALALEAWSVLPLFLLVSAGVRQWHRPTPSADAGSKARVGPAMPVPPHQTRQTHMSQVVDQLLTRHPHWLEARFIKASILWHIHGDRDGARCHCRDLLGRIQRDNPLFEEVCNLYMQTCNPAPHRSTPPAINDAPESSFPDWSALAGAGRGEVVSLPSKRFHLRPQ